MVGGNYPGGNDNKNPHVSRRLGDRRDLQNFPVGDVRSPWSVNAGRPFLPSVEIFVVAVERVAQCRQLLLKIVLFFPKRVVLFFVLKKQVPKVVKTRYFFNMRLYICYKASEK